MKKTQLKKLLVASTIAIMAAPIIASAGSSNHDVNSIRISYSDLDLSREAGLKVLYKRLQAASRTACGPQYSVRSAGSIDRLNGNKKCYKAALADAVANFDNPGLSEIHDGYRQLASR